MKEPFQVSGYLVRGNGIPPKTLVLTFGVSFLCHAVLIGAMFFLPEYKKPMGNPFPSAINVSLVSFSAGPPAGEIPVAGDAAAEAEKAGLKKEAPVIKVDKAEKISKPAIKEEKIKKTVSLSPKKIPEKKVETSKLINNAIKNIEKKIDESRSVTVASAINRLKNQVERSGNIKTSGVPGGGIKTNAPAGIPGGFGTGGGTGGAAGVIDIYKAEIYYRIQQNWAYSEQLGGSNSEQIAVLVIKIMPGGEISDIWFERKSGNRFLDESAYRAVQKSNPLPPIPQEYNRPYYEVGLRFGAGGLSQK
ncbi:MAG: cell envelope integrity protein TolA [Desulfobacterales bacterium]